MSTRRILILACIGLALFVSIPATSANAEECYYCNPLLFPFAVAGAVVGTAAAIVTAPFCPYCGPRYIAPPPPPPPAYYAPPPPPRAYYGPPPAAGYSGPPQYRAWVRGHYDREGRWVPGHWKYRRNPPPNG